MTATERSVPATADPLGETLHLLRLTGTLYCRSELTAPWGVDLPALPDCMMFHLVTAGRCRLEVAGEPPRLLERGSLVLLPHGEGHTIRSAEGVAAPPLFDLPIERVSDRYEILRHGGGGERAQVICCVARFDHVAASHLVAELPKVLQIDSWHDADAGSWLASTMRFVAREAQALRPGGETVITRLADVLVIQLIRTWIDSASAAGRGWLGALRDPQLGAALNAIHRSPGAPWSVATLAEQACMSRSAFAARFTELVGEPVGRYLTSWRLRLARERLRAGPVAIAAVADELGYRSEAAFCRAFKREFGVSPGRSRRQE